MSNLLEQASLVMIPSGYKEDVVYSEIPLDGSGDLQLTRASNGTRVNSAGLVEVCPWNLAFYSEDFSNTAWTKTGASITANDTTAPNGTTTADKILASAVNSEHGVYNATPYASNFVGEVYTYSVYAKKGTVDYLVIDHYQGTYTFTWFNLNTGTLGTVASGVTATIESVGNGWYRCSCTKAITSTSVNYIGIYLSNANNTWSFNAAGTETIYIWGAQVNVSTAKPYFPTTDRLNVPRLTYQNGGGGCPSLLLEKQSTNLVTYSEQFDNAGWVKYQGGTITANSVTSPDGTQNADTLNVASGQTYSGIYQSVSGSSDVYTISIFAKYNTKRWMFIFDASSSGQGWFDLQNGVVGTIPIGHTATIENFGNGWYRCTFKKNTAVTPAFFQIGLVDADGNSTPSSNGSSYIWGAQFEASSYATSYIPTTSSSATRVADAFALKDITSFSIGNAYTILLDVTMQSSDNNKLFFETRTSTNATSLTARNFNGALRLFNNIDASYPLAAVSSSTNKWVVRINGTSYDLFAVSGGIATKDSATITTARNFGYFELAGSTTQLYFDELVIFPTALTDAECQSLVL